MQELRHVVLVHVFVLWSASFPRPGQRGQSWEGRLVRH
jgi:hypothetical protein